MNKHPILDRSHYFLLGPRPVILVTCYDKSKDSTNITTAGWSMPMSIDPPLVGVMISPLCYSHHLICQTNEFIINIPNLELVHEVLYCGRNSGREYNKFLETNLTQVPSKKLKASIIKECIAHLECKVKSEIDTFSDIKGDHSIFVGKVLCAYADSDAFNERGSFLKKIDVLFHIRRNTFTTTKEKKYSIDDPEVSYDDWKKKLGVFKKEYSNKCER